MYTLYIYNPLTMNIPAAKHLETELISFQVIDVGFSSGPRPDKFSTVEQEITPSKES